MDAERNLRKAFDAWADANAYFLPVTTDPDGPWITGSGAVDKPKGDGNMEQYYISVDGHPLQRGVNCFAQRYAQALKSFSRLVTGLDRRTSLKVRDVCCSVSSADGFR